MYQLTLSVMQKTTIAMAISFFLCTGTLFIASEARAQALTTNVTSQDPQIATLMALLQQLIAIYQQLLAEQQGKSVESSLVTPTKTEEISKITIKLLSPLNSELYLQGDTIPVEWVSKGLSPTDLVSIQLLNSKKEVAYSYMEKNTGSLFLTPNSTMFYPAGKYFIRISPAKCGDGKCTNDLNAPHFTIANNSDINTELITITSPTQGGVYSVTDASIIVGWELLPWNRDYFKVYLGNTVSDTEVMLTTGQANNTINRASNGFVISQGDLRSFRLNLNGKTLTQVKASYYVRVKAIEYSSGIETVIAEGKSGSFTIE